MQSLLNYIILTGNRFRWAACQLDVLEGCLDYRQLKKALASLPKTLDDTYGRILTAIPAEYKAHVVRILQFLTFSERLLSVKEIVDAIAVDTEAEPYFDARNRMPDPQEVSRYCSSLVAVDSTGSGDVLQLAHFSVKEYLTSDRLDSGLAPAFHKVTASASIARVCVAYLLHFNEIISPEEAATRFPLALYSAKFWMRFAAAAEDDKEGLLQLIERLFCFQEAPYKVCYSLHRPDRPRLIYQENRLLDRPASPLYYAALGGLRGTVHMLLDKKVNVNAQGGNYGNALQAASLRGHEQVVKLLLEKKADVNAQGGEYGNALQAASAGGHEQVVKLLLEKNADVNAQGGHYGSALQVASVRGHEQIVKLLLKKGAVAFDESGNQSD